MLARFRSKVARRSLVGALLIVVVAPLSALAWTHTIDGVVFKGGSGRYLAYVNYSRYTDDVSHADSKWSALGHVSVYPMEQNTIYPYDVKLFDYRGDKSLCGYLDPNPTPAHIGFNLECMEPYGDFDEKSVATHEMGHALGINDHYSGYSNQIMYSCPGCTSMNTPQSHDQSDYYARWP